jgi:hypothetical protein
MRRKYVQKGYIYLLYIITLAPLGVMLSGSAFLCTSRRLRTRREGESSSGAVRALVLYDLKASI